MTSHISSRIARFAIRAVVALIILNAVIAIIAILFAGGDREWQVIGTTSLITAATFTVAVNAAAYERWRWPVVPASGVVFSVFAFGVFIWIIWTDPHLDDGFAKFLYSTLTLGIGASYASLVQIPRLPHAFEPARLVSLLGDATLVVMTLLAIAMEDASGELYAIVSIIVAASALIILIGTRSSRAKDDAALAHFCPACASPLTHPDRCTACGARFRIDFSTASTDHGDTA